MWIFSNYIYLSTIILISFLNVSLFFLSFLRSEFINLLLCFLNRYIPVLFFSLSPFIPILFFFYKMEINGLKKICWGTVKSGIYLERKYNYKIVAY